MNISVPVVVRAMTICIAASIGCGAAEASSRIPSNESPSDAPLTSVVHFSDLDIARMEGAKTLYARLRRAAKEVCEPLESASTWGGAAHRACVNKAVEDAVANIDRPLLSQYHRLRTKGARVGVVRLATE